jgi:hypothetical protein
MIERGERMRVYVCIGKWARHVTGQRRRILGGCPLPSYVRTFLGWGQCALPPTYVGSKKRSFISGGTTRCFHWPGDLVRVQLAFSFQLEYRVEDALKLAIGDIKSFFYHNRKLGPKF